VYPTSVAAEHSAEIEATKNANEKAAKGNCCLNCSPDLRGKDDRQKFVIKVYGIVTSMLAFTSACVAVAMSSEDRIEALNEHWYLLYVFLGLGFLIMILIVCKEDCAKKVPNNYILLFSFTLCWSGMIMMFCAFYEPIIVLVAAVTTFAVTLGCTLIAMCIPGEMTWCYGIAGGIMCAMWPMIIFSLFWPDKWLSNLICFLGAILSSVYIVIDTKAIMRRLKTD
jgi:protein lifeguard